MIDYAQARQIALAHIGPDCALIEEATFEKPYGWYFCGQSRAYLETGNIMVMLVGGGGFIVERENGRIFAFGSAYPLDTWIANYERGFKYASYDLVITAVYDMHETARLLQRLDMTFVLPETAYGVEWKIPEQYGHKQLLAALKRLPCLFQDQAFWHKVEVFDQIDVADCCAYELREHQ